MGLLSSLKAFGQNTLKSGNVLGKSLDVISGVFSHPITAVTKGVSASTKAFTEQTKGQRALSTLTATAGYVTAVTGAGALSGLTKAGTFGGAVSKAISTAITGTAKAIGKSFVAHPISTSAGVLLGAPTVAVIISKKPELITSLPKKAYEGGQKLVDVIEENPNASAVVGGIGGGVLLYELYDKLLKDKDKDLNIQIPGGSLPKEIPSSVDEEDAISVIDKSGQMNTQPYTPITTPTTPKTETLKNGSPTKRRKSKKATPPQNISQKVNVIVSNKSSSIGVKQSKTYLKERLLYN